MPWRTLDLEQAAQAADALLHRVQTEMTRKRSQRIKPHPIVAHLQDDCVGRLAQSQLHLFRMRMLDGVVHRLLRDAVKFLFDGKRQVRLLAQLCLDGNAMP